VAAAGVNAGDTPGGRAGAGEAPGAQPGPGDTPGAARAAQAGRTPPAGTVVEVAAPAKINLGLLVGPRRPDGFHEIVSPMLPVTLADLVTARPAPPGAGLAVECAVAPGEDNLAARAVRELERRLERTFDVSLSIAKRVPAAAGLGGGSSDAAAALTAVERLFALDLPARLRYEVAGAVGSDVPFFLWPGPQLAMGRGTVLKEIELPEPLHVVIALPALALATADVYRWFDERPGPARAAPAERKAFVERSQTCIARLGAARRPRDLAAVVENDLEAAVVARHPVIGELERCLRRAGAFAAAMSGSGSSVFGLFVSAASAQRALAALTPTRAVYVTDLQPRAAAAPGRSGAHGALAPDRSAPRGLRGPR
jgi:4-diphosphocytidyl-2-C-methyl-D-erythritol kinase